MNLYLRQAASDLKAADYAGYVAAISELTDLANTPATDVTTAQQAHARADVQALDSFFGTPGLLS